MPIDCLIVIPPQHATQLNLVLKQVLIESVRQTIFTRNDFGNNYLDEELLSKEALLDILRDGPSFGQVCSL